NEYMALAACSVDSAARKLLAAAVISSATTWRPAAGCAQADKTAHSEMRTRVAKHRVVFMPPSQCQRPRNANRKCAVKRGALSVVRGAWCVVRKMRTVI